MSQVRLSFEGTNAIELAEILKGFPGCEVTVTVSEDGVVRGDKLEKVQKVIVVLTLGAKLLQQGAEAGSAGVEFMQKMQEFQSSSAAIEKIVVIPEEGDRLVLDSPSGAVLVEAVRGVN